LGFVWPQGEIAAKTNPLETPLLLIEETTPSMGLFYRPTEMVAPFVSGLHDWSPKRKSHAPFPIASMFVLLTPPFHSDVGATSVEIARPLVTKLNFPAAIRRDRHTRPRAAAPDLGF